MDKKFFVPFETAKLLKEKGYPQLNNKHHYNLNGDMVIFSGAYEGYTEDALIRIAWDFYVAAPTYHEVIDWLEEKGIRIEVRMAYHFREKQWSWCGYVYIVEDEDYEISQLADWSSTREEALNAAILAALKML